MDKDAVDLIDRLMVISPLERLGIGLKGTALDFDALKAHKFFKGIDFKRLKNKSINQLCKTDSL